jgi:ribulose-5-phosphate 4-epimerase/fuculose-1-phosphate aldolase
MSPATFSLEQYATTRHPTCSDAEWQLRCELSACFRLIDMYGMSDMAVTHTSVRVPGDAEHFLINPLGLFFDEMTASALIKVDVDGKLIEGNPDHLNPGGFVIHSAIHIARPDLICVMHTHTRANNAIAMQKEGLLPLSQKAVLLWHYLRYHDYEGASLGLSERERIRNDLGEDGRVMVLRNHGGLTVGASIAEAFVWMYRLEAACRFQVDGLSGARALNFLSEETIEHTARQGRQLFGPGGAVEAGRLEWAALLRKLERERGLHYRS